MGAELLTPKECQCAGRADSDTEAAGTALDDVQEHLSLRGKLASLIGTHGHTPAALVAELLIKTKLQWGGSTGFYSLVFHAGLQMRKGYAS